MLSKFDALRVLSAQSFPNSIVPRVISFSGSISGNELLRKALDALMPGLPSSTLSYSNAILLKVVDFLHHPDMDVSSKASEILSMYRRHRNSVLIKITNTFSYTSKKAELNRPPCIHHI